MKKIEPGFLLLLVAVMFSIVAAGHVSLDARPLEGTPFGLIITLIASVLVPLGVWFLMRKEGENDVLIGSVMIGLAGAIIVADAHPKFNFLVGGEMFATIRMFASLMVFGGLTYVLLKQRVVPLPGAWYGGMVVMIVAAMGTSVMISEFRSVSLAAWSNWLLYGAAFYLTIATVGRIRGPRMLLETIVSGAAFVALKGIYEFLLIRELVPSHRIFADWNNPNALAGLLVIALPLALALTVTNKTLLHKIFAIVSGGLILCALVLSQSKGGLLVAPIGVVVFLIATLIWRAGKKSLWGLVPLAAGVLFFGMIQMSTPAAETAGAPLQRLSAASAEQAQSTEYRKLLWRGAVELISQSPVGHGAGTYRFVSAKPGLHEQTHLTHQSFLQLAVEGGFLALFGAVMLALLWVVRMFLGTKALDLDRNILRAGVLGAVVACAANGFLESNLFYLGSGLLMFVLIAVGLQLASDGSSPESLPSGLRYMIVGTCCAVPIILSIWMFRVESGKLLVMTSLVNRDAASIRSSLEALSSSGSFDDESIYLRALYASSSSEERLELLQKATEHGPRTKYLRALATALNGNGKTEEALQTIEHALFYDPNNFRTLLLKMEMEREYDLITAATSTAKRLIAVEETSYWKVRAIPEYIPTETYQARLFLAEQTPDLEERVKLRREALDGYVRYADITVPKVVQMAEGGAPSFAGDTLKSAEEKLAIAINTAQEISTYYESVDDSQAATELDDLLTKFKAILDQVIELQRRISAA